MNHSGEGLLIYRRGKKFLTDFETLRSCLQVELHGDESLERLPLALYSAEENEHRRSKSATIADNLSGKGQRQAKENADLYRFIFLSLVSPETISFT